MAFELPKPTILLAHGAWHTPKLYEPLKQALASRGYDLVLPALPSMGVDATGVGWDVDTATLLAHAEPLFEEGKEVVIVGHAYGGIPACVATRNSGVEERAVAGKRGGFRHIVFLCAFAIPAASMSELTTQRIIENEYGGKQLLVNEQAHDLLFNDLPAEQAQEYFEALVPRSYAAAVQPVDSVVPDITIPKTYVVCEADQAFPVAFQHYLADTLGFSKQTIRGGHSAFASVPDELAEVLVRISEKK